MGCGKQTKSTRVAKTEAVWGQERDRGQTGT